jgi:hypothetical protein
MTQQATSDRELLEAAAKAAGIELHWDEDGPNEVTYYGATKTWGTWNPLTDDGDALRLAVKLDMQIWRRPGGFVCGMRNGIDFWHSLNEPLAPDAYAATRRAIVRAAAAISRAGEA